MHIAAPKTSSTASSVVHTAPSQQQQQQQQAVFTWKINNLQYPLLFDGYIRGIKQLDVYIHKDIVALCMDYYLEYDLIALFKNLQKEHTFQSLLFNIGPFEWKMTISVGYRFDLVLLSVPQSPRKIHKLQFTCTVRLVEIGKHIQRRWIILHVPQNEQTINSMIHYFTLDAIMPFNTFTYQLAIGDFAAFDIDGEDITNEFITDRAEFAKRAAVWTTTEDEWLLRLISRKGHCD